MRVSKEREQRGQEWSPLLGAGWSVLWMEAEDTSSQRKFVLGGRKEPDQDSEKPVSEEAGFRHGNSRVRPAEPLPRRCCLAGWTLDLQLWVEGRAGKGAVWDWERRGGEEGGATPLCRPCREMWTRILGGSCYCRDMWRGRAQPGLRRAELAPGSPSPSEGSGRRAKSSGEERSHWASVMP